MGDVRKAVSEAFDGILGGLSEIVSRLGEIAEGGEAIKREGQFTVEPPRPGGRVVKGVYGVSIKTGVGGAGPKVDPFGNIRRDKVTGQAVVEEVREPIVDVFDEDGHVLIVAEMPGVAAGDIHLDVRDDILTITAQNGDKKYRKEILLPAPIDAKKESVSLSCKNGIVEIKCPKP